MNGLPHARPLPARILVVDPDAATRATVVQVLGEAGYETREAESAEAAERVLHEFAPELTLLETAKR